MKILFLIAVAWGSKLRAGCNNVNKNGKSECFQQWKKSGKKDTKDALQCCMSYREREISEFNVPIIILKHGEQTNMKNKRETTKCYPELSPAEEIYSSPPFKDINGFFNFLDLYHTIPSTDSPDNWNCFNTNDTFNDTRILKPLSKTRRKRSLESQAMTGDDAAMLYNLQQRQIIEERLHKKQNFCRSLLYEYHVIYSSNAFQRDLCDGEKIVPYQHAGLVKFSKFDLSRQIPRNWESDFLTTMFFIGNRSGKIQKNMSIKVYQRKRSKNTITVFEDFRKTWETMGVKFPENFRKRTRKRQIVHREFHCGCFDFFT